jgi:hypothetical protein
MSGPGPIPWTAIDHYAERQGYTQDVLIYEDFIAYIHALDAEYLAVVQEEMSRKQKEAENKGRAKSR